MFQIPIGVAVVFLGLVSCSAVVTSPRASDAARGALRHVVLFQFKEGTQPEQVRAIEDAFRRLPSQIPQILDFEWGTDVGVENHDDGFTHCFLVTFGDAAGRDAYLPHPAHEEFVALLKPFLEKVLVLDYFARR